MVPGGRGDVLTNGGSVRKIQLPLPRGGGGVLIVAHRGNKAAHPENTRAAFERAINEGADLLETDIRVSADGVFVCFHDERLERMTDGRGRLQEKSIADLKLLRVRQRGREWSGERIATIEEFAALLPADVAAALELKDRRFFERKTCEKLVECLEKLGLRSRTIILGFSRKQLGVMREVAPDLPIGHVTFFPFPFGSADLLGPPWPILLLNPFYVRHAHRRGRIVCPLDSHPDHRLGLYRSLGRDALLTDDPGATIRELHRRRKPAHGSS